MDRQKIRLKDAIKTLFTQLMRPQTYIKFKKYLQKHPQAGKTAKVKLVLNEGTPSFKEFEIEKFPELLNAVNTSDIQKEGLVGFIMRTNGIDNVAAIELLYYLIIIIKKKQREINNIKDLKKALQDLKQKNDIEFIYLKTGGKSHLNSYIGGKYKFLLHRKIIETDYGEPLQINAEILSAEDYDDFLESCQRYFCFKKYNELI